MAFSPNASNSLPLLVVPPHLQHGGSGKYNYAVAQDKPFTFDAVTQQTGEGLKTNSTIFFLIISMWLTFDVATNFTVTVESDEFLKELTEPDEGAFLPDFDGKVPKS